MIRSEVITIYSYTFIKMTCICYQRHRLLFFELSMMNDIEEDCQQLSTQTKTSLISAFQYFMNAETKKKTLEIRDIVVVIRAILSAQQAVSTSSSPRLLLLIHAAALVFRVTLLVSWHGHVKSGPIVRHSGTQLNTAVAQHANKCGVILLCDKLKDLTLAPAMKCQAREEGLSVPRRS